MKQELITAKEQEFFKRNCNHECFYYKAWI